ncbi:MAG: tetratricopeptide repeat protein [Nitrososphaerales archaeon]
MRHAPDPIAKKYYDIGSTLFEQNKHEEAIACYTRAIEEDREYGSAYFNRALSYAILDKCQEAARTLAPSSRTIVLSSQLSDKLARRMR